MFVDFIDICWVVDIYIMLNGCYLYISDCIVSLLGIFSVFEDGCEIVLVGYYQIEVQLCGFNIDYNGQFLIFFGQKFDYIEVYCIDQNSGELIIFKCYLVGKGLMWVSILVLRV